MSFDFVRETYYEKVGSLKEGVTVHGFRVQGLWVNRKPACRRCRLRGGAIPARSTAGGRRAGLNRLFMNSEGKTSPE